MKTLLRVGLGATLFSLGWIAGIASFALVAAGDPDWAQEQIDSIRRAKAGREK